MDGMNPGLRVHGGASVRVAIAQGLPVQMWEQTRELIDLQSANRRRGEASALLHTVCAEADRAWLTLLIMPQEGDDVDKLRRFYTRFGFVEIQSDPCLMARDPQPPAIARMH
jgi:hypothetical protein